MCLAVSMGKPVRNGELAFSLFESLETGGSLGPRSQLWLLYRPPWGAQPLCSKRFVFTRISHVAQVSAVCQVHASRGGKEQQRAVVISSLVVSLFYK